MERFAFSVTNHSSSIKEPFVYNNLIMYNIKDWLQPYVNDFHGHTGPHIFFINRNADGNAVFKYKKWSSTSEQWKPEEGIRLFKVN